MKNTNIRFKDDNNKWNKQYIKNICTLTTGKLDANAAKKDGDYTFFTCGKEILKTDTFAFDGDAILINGNGDLGFTRKYSGKFNAYQRTYVLQEFTEDYNFVEHMIKKYLPSKIKEESFGGAMPYIRSSTITELKIPLLDNKIQCKIASLLSNIDTKIELQEQKINNLKTFKIAMLNKMFPKEGYFVPEVRFPGFTGDWEQFSLYKFIV